MRHSIYVTCAAAHAQHCMRQLGVAVIFAILYSTVSLFCAPACAYRHLCFEIATCALLIAQFVQSMRIAHHSPRAMRARVRGFAHSDCRQLCLLLELSS